MIDIYHTPACRGMLNYENDEKGKIGFSRESLNIPTQQGQTIKSSHSVA